MALHWFDLAIIFVILFGMIVVARYSAGYMKSVADFLAANRMAPKYLLTVATGGTGSVGMIAAWQMLNSAGLSTDWWGTLTAPVGLFLALTGFIIFRFRETRALTLAQFFEMRYSRRFRFFAGTLSWVAGILNYGVFPAVTARAIMALTGVPDSFCVYGIELSTFPCIMAGYLTIAVYIACIGGQISIMLSDFYQESLCKIGLIAVTLYLFFHFGWDNISAGLLNAPAGKSMVNPFDGNQIDDFNIWYFLIGVYGMIFNARSWQGGSGYNAAAKTPHDAQFAGILANWRNLATMLLTLLPPLVAYAIMHNTIYADLAQEIQAGLDQIADPQVRSQSVTPLVLRYVLPAGMLGFFVALIISGCISIDDTYTHSWGTIFVQDVVMPLRRKPFEPKRHMLYFRLSIVGVAVFAFLFSWFFPFKDHILMFFALSGAIYLGGAGITIIGGLYTRWGTTAAAYAAMISGTVLGFGGMLLEQIWPTFLCPWLIKIFPAWDFLLNHQQKFPINGQVTYFIAMITATFLYVIISFTGKQSQFDLNRMLHRDEKRSASLKRKQTLGERLGLTPEFSKFERFIFWATLIWSLSWWGIFIVGTALNLSFFRMSDQAWCWYWWFKIYLSLLIGIITSVWILCGGLRDAVKIFKELNREKVDVSDDGFIKNNLNKR